MLITALRNAVRLPQHTNLFQFITEYAPINVKITKIAVLIHIAARFLKMIEQKLHSQLDISLNDLFLEFLMGTKKKIQVTFR